MLKKTILFTLIGAIALSGTSVFAKSLSLIPGNMDYRRQLISEPAFRNFVKTSPENYVYYGAKFEPRAGAYIGTPYDRPYPGIGNGINTQYDWFVPSDEIKNDVVERKEIPEKESNHTSLLGHNWNFALKNDKVIDITEYSNYIYNYIDQLAARGEDILLIFGKEFNIDDNFNDPELFKRCFRFVADYAHTKENIAMVWAPNDTGGLDTTFEEFYPGDEYVDWIGCSLYSLRYFQGNPNVDDGANMSFIMGDWANPSMRAKMLSDFMQKNNIKKPVFITEGGVGFESPDGTDYTEWANHQLKMYYADLCRAYPEYKCIVSFNQYVYPGDLYRYDMAKNPILLATLQELTSDPVYLQSYPATAPYAYTDLPDGMIFTGAVEVSSYAYIPKKPNLIVRYLIDGQWVAEKDAPPYELRLTDKDISYGWHTLTCEIYDGSKISHSKSYSIALNPGDDNYAYSDEKDNNMCMYFDMQQKPAEMKNAVAFLTQKGILNGVDNLNFAPERKISRAELGAMLMRLMGLRESQTPSGFSDVTPDLWYYGIVNAISQRHYIDGYEDNTFRGDNAINRNEFITVMTKIVQREKDYPVPELELNYADELDGWAVNYIRVAKANNLILERADGLFSGRTEVTRGDAAIMIKRLYDCIK
ncbi:MAG: S-layer homology domain-containing protein [Clostridia bacterium]|nr:S-layer homology domain-containing protein [Clostridia bacterium]